MLFDFEKSFAVAAIAFCRPFRVISGEEVRVSARKSDRIERLTRRSSSLAMLLLLKRVRPIDERGQNFDQHMVATKAEGRCLCRHS